MNNIPGTYLLLLIWSLFELPLAAQVRWEHISSTSGAIEVPNKGKQQTSAAVADFNNDGINDFCITERTSAPSVVWYQRSGKGWKRHVVEDAICFIEAGTIAFDVDNDGDMDIIAGGESKTNQVWFKYLGEDKFSYNVVDAAYTFSRSVAGQLVNGGRPEIVLVVGDGLAPMYMYEYQKNTWVKKEIVQKVSNGHSLAIVDFDGDGKRDIWYAEMTLGGYKEAVSRILFGDGKGNFERDMIISKGIDLHDSEIVDLDGDGDLDILGKPYDGDAPRIDIWLQNGTNK